MTSAISPVTQTPPATTTRRHASAGNLAEALLQQAGLTAAASLCGPLALLLAGHLRFDAADPLWPDRDRLLVHDELAGLAQAGARLSGAAQPPGLFDLAPEPVGAAAGAALAERMLAARFGRSLVDHRAWVLTDGQSLATGPVQEAACLAGLWRLGRLTVIASDAGHDAGGLLQAGAAGLAACGWTVRRVASRDFLGLDGALSAALRSFKPTLIVCTSEVPPDASSSWPGALPAGAPPGAAIEVGAEWQVTAGRRAGIRRGWLKRVARHAGRSEFEEALAGRLSAGWHARLADPAWLQPAGPPVSTAHAVRQVLADLGAAMPGLAMLPGLATWPWPALQAEPATGRSAGALTSGGASALAGLAVHGGVVPYAAYGLGAADQIRPALERAAASGCRAIGFLVEDSGGLTAGGMAGLRATPRLGIHRPADVTEALECVDLALRHAGGPSVLVLSEHPVPQLADRPTRTRAARGGYIAAGATGPRAATLLASGPELHAALAARTRLLVSGVAVSVVSLPCWDLFARQDVGWRNHVLGTAPLVGLESSCGFGWERWLGRAGLFIRLPGGPAAPLDEQAALIALAVLRHCQKPSNQL